MTFADGFYFGCGAICAFCVCGVFGCIIAGLLAKYDDMKDKKE